MNSYAKILLILSCLGLVTCFVRAQDRIPLSRDSLQIIRHSFLQHEQLTGVSLSMPEGYDFVEDWICLGNVPRSEEKPFQLMTCRFFFRSQDQHVVIGVGFAVPAAFRGYEDHFIHRLLFLTRRFAPEKAGSALDFTCVSGEWVNHSFGADSLFIYSPPGEITLYQFVSASMQVCDKEEIRKEKYPQSKLVRLSTAEGYYQELAFFFTEGEEQSIFKYLTDLAGHICLDRERMTQVWQILDPIPGLSSLPN